MFLQREATARFHRDTLNLKPRADVDALMAELPQVSRAVVIGGGYIGLEAAAVGRQLGLCAVHR